MDSKESINQNQNELLSLFYQLPATKISFSKSERASIWSNFIQSRTIPVVNLSQRCPALLEELEKAIQSHNNVQSAVFSECVYSQTLADMFGLTDFYSYSKSPGCITSTILKVLEINHLKPRYIYKSSKDSSILIQAGGHAGTDGALIKVEDGKIYTIEFKEPAAKASEPDLPPYGEDGRLIATSDFLKKHPQFKDMLLEQVEKGLTFWEAMGSNVNDFNHLNIQTAISNNYSANKYADVICVEDQAGYLTMIPSHEVQLWAKIRGEIRPAGRNDYRVWTPIALETFIYEKGGVVRQDEVRAPITGLETAKPRGGGNVVSRLKINPLFFVRAENTRIKGGYAEFSLHDVRQLRPTISAHMFFKELKYQDVKNYYLRDN